MVKEREEDDTVKKILLSMYKNFSGNFISSKYIEEQIENPFVIQSLIKNHYLEPMGTDYSLGANALPLISAWKTEELSKEVRTMTRWLMILTAILLIITAAQLFFILKPYL